jgi:hypothetical protein
VDDPMQSLVWRGTPQSVQFEVEVPDDYPHRSAIGTVIVSQQSIPIGHIKFKLSVCVEGGGRAEAPQPLGDDARHYEQAFVSYASKDRQKVLERVQMLNALGVRYFQDVLDLDPGERWEQRLYEKIAQADVFLLFWSNESRKSEWVRREVDFALAQHGDAEFGRPEICPVIIEGPPVVPPWPELSHLHFNDQVLYFIAAEAAQ